MDAKDLKDPRDRQRAERDERRHRVRTYKEKPSFPARPYWFGERRKAAEDEDGA
jgi:hypothetical protein